MSTEDTGATETSAPNRDVVELEGWRLLIREGEPLMSDDVLAKQLEVERRWLRRLIRTHMKPGNIAPILCTQSTKSGRGRPSEDYLLTEVDALFLVTRSNAPKAIEMTKAMIAVFVAVRRQLAARGPRGGMGPAEKQRNYRHRHKDDREAELHQQLVEATQPSPTIPFSRRAILEHLGPLLTLLPAHGDIEAIELLTTLMQRLLRATPPAHPVSAPARANLLRHLGDAIAQATQGGDHDGAHQTALLLHRLT